MKLAFCPICKKPLAAGQLPSEVTKKGKKVPYVYKHTLVDGKGARTVHEGKLADLPDTSQNPNESPGDYLKRLWELYRDR